MMPGARLHASDGGLFGDEEERIIAPAVEQARQEGIDVTGPWPADTLFVRAHGGEFDGIVILPGQTFSFWELLGPVTVERGYAYAGAIINNRSDENVIGGGLCQVSTTMFNAVSRLGYEIVERHAHGYLIDRYPLGLDAAVFDAYGWPRGLSG